MSRICKERAVGEIEEQLRLHKDAHGNIDENDPAVIAIRVCAEIVNTAEEEGIAHAINKIGGGFECSNCGKYIRQRVIDEYGEKPVYCPNCGYKLKYPEERLKDRERFLER